MAKTKPNEACPCSSGKKYKKCCMKQNVTSTSDTTTRSNASDAIDTSSSPPAASAGGNISRGRMGEEERRYNPNRDTQLDVGVVALVHSLQSTRGQALNDKRCVLLQYLATEQRWKVQVQEEDTTTALKSTNLKLPRPPEGETHPAYLEMAMWLMQQYPALQTNGGRPAKKYRNARGVTFDDDEPFYRARKLVELLDRQIEYEPNQTIIHGEAGKYYSIVPESSMMDDFTMTDIEHLSGLLALAAMCQGEVSGATGCGHGRSDAVVFALLEAAPVSLDILMGFLVITPYVGPSQGYSGDIVNDFGTCRPSANFEDWSLTPDQSHNDYCNAMRGPLGILIFVCCKLKDTPSRLDKVLLGRLQNHVLFSKVMHRLFRLAARELQGTNDGKSLGQYARSILANMADLDGQMSNTMYNLLTGEKWMWGPGNVEQKMLAKDDIDSYHELYAFLQELLPRDTVDRFKLS